MTDGRATVVIVDDEAPARELLRSLLSDRIDLDIIGEAEHGADAVRLVVEQKPDLVFLDVQMPELNGFDVIEAVGPGRMPPVIFVSAYDQFALRAFEVHALDYVLKPFDRALLMRAVDHALARLRTPQEVLAEQFNALLAHMHAQPRFPDRIAVRHDGRTLQVELATVDWIEAANKQVRLHAGEKVYEVRATMRALEEELDPARFVRIHRSTIVNVDRVRELQPWVQSTQVLTLHDGTKLYSGPGYDANVRRIVNTAVPGQR